MVNVNQRTKRRAMMVGTALGCTMGVAPALAQNVTYTGPGPYALTQTTPLSGGPRTVDVTVTSGDASVDTSATTVANSNTGTALGAAIAVNNTGAGAVTIRNGQVDATGSGPTNAVDARATTGLITIVNAGTINASGNSTDRAISASSGGGDVTITSNVANGQLRGIAVGSNGGTFGATGTTTINSTTATANGTGAVNAILGQGNRVVINSGTASNTNVAGNTGTAIFANASTGGVLVNAGTTTAFGQNQAAIQVFSEGVVDVTSGALRTTQNSDGLSIQTGTNVVVRSGTIVTEGAGGARGLVLGGNSGGGGFNGGPNGFGYTSANVTSGSIATVGNGAYGIYATPNGSGATTITTNAIRTTGANATGVLVTPIGTGVIGGPVTINNTGTLQTSGASANGIQVNGGAGAVTVANTGQVTATGNFSTGILLQGGAGARTVTSNRITTGSGDGIAIFSDGVVDVRSDFITRGISAGTAISVFGDTDRPSTVTVTSGSITGGGSGINANAAGDLRIISGTIALTGTAGGNATSVSGIGISAIGSGAVRIDSNSVAFTGQGNTLGITAQATGTGPAASLLINSGDVSVIGNGGYGILGASQTGSITINSTGSVTTTGTTRQAGGQAGVASSRYADGILGYSQSGAITITNAGRIDTAGAMARGISVETGRAIQSFGSPAATASTAAITINNSGAINTRGLNAVGISVLADSNPVTIDSGAITTSGQGAHGIFIRPGTNVPLTGPVAITSGTITTGGQSALGMFVTNANGLAITSNAITTTGAGVSTGMQVASSATSTNPITVTSGTIDLLNTSGNGSGIVVTAGATGSTTVTSRAITNAGNGGGISVVTPIGATGDVSITSGDITLSAPPSAGFRPAINAFVTAGTTTINSTGTITSGGDGILVQSRPGQVAGAVRITSNVITSANSAINVSGGSSVVVDAATSSTSGNGQAAIFVAPSVGGTVAVRAGALTTTGANAAGVVTNGMAGATSVTVDTASTSASAIDARSVGAVSLTAGTVQTTGAGATGLVAISSGGDASVTSTNLTSANRGIYAQGLDNVTVVTGTLVSSNADFGLIARTSAAANNDPVVGTAEGVVDVTSTALTASNVGINAYGPRATINVQSGSVTTGNGTGIQAFGIDVNVTSGTVTSGTNGIEAGNGTGAPRRGATVVNSDTINIVGSVEGAVSGGMSVNGASVLINSGTITATGVGNRYGINAQVPTSTVAGTTSAGAVTINSGSITTVGNGAYGIQGVSDSGLLSINSTGTITTTGTTRFAGNQPRYSAGIVAFSPAGAIAVTSNNISTAGDQADGIRVEAGSGGQGTFAAGPNNAAAPISVTTTGLTQTAGANAAGINVFGGGGTVAVANTGTISTSGDASYGISIVPGEGTSAITSNIVSTTGAGATGIRVVGLGGAAIVTAATTSTAGLGANAIDVRTGGAVTVDSATASAVQGTGVLVRAGGLATVRAGNASGSIGGVSAVGGTGVSLGVTSAASTGVAATDANGVVTRADAIFAEATNGAITATIGSASATGAGADAVRLIANGTGGAVTARVTGVVTSTNGYGLFIDPPGAVVIDVAAGARITGASAGISTVGGSNTITNAGTISSTGGAAIVAAGPSAIDNSGTLTGVGGTAVQLGAANDTVTLRTGSLVTGAIVGGGGTDAAVLIGTGTAPVNTQQVAGFTGFDSLTVQSGYWTAPATTASTIGRTIIGTAGTLEVQNASTGIAGYATGTIANDGTLVVRSSAASAGSTFGATTVTGTGGVTFTGAGTTTLGGTNTLTNTGTNVIEGGTVIVTGTQGGSFATSTAGVLQVGTGGNTGTFTGNLANNGTLIVNRSDDSAFSGALTGAGTFVKQGTGRITFGTGYAFTGTTQLNGGAIRLTGPVAVTTELDLRGTGQIDFSGSNQTIAELQGNSAAASVNIAGGSLTVNQATSTIFAGALVGAGSLTKAGSGTLNLTGVNSYSGPTAINGGRLLVNGSIVSPVTVNAGGTLGGTGVVGSTGVASGGTWAPGNSIGTQTVNGNVTFAAGSIYQVEVNAAGAADRINATGTATLSGGTVQVLAENGTYARQTAYTIITANGGVSGRFAGATSNFAFLSPFLSYGSNAVTLTLARNDLAFGAVATTGNQLATANAIFARGAADPLFNTLLFQSVTDAPTTFAQLSGELNAGLATELADNGRRVRQAVLDRGVVASEGLGMWAQGLQSTGMSDANANRARLKSNRTGVIGGVDYAMNGIRVGAFGGYQDDDVTLRGRGSSAEVETSFAGLHAAWLNGPLSVQVGGLYAWHDTDTSRSFGASGIASVTASPDANSAQLFAEAGYALTQGPVVVTPFLRHAYTWTRVKAFTELGGTGALSVARDRRDIGLASAGVRIDGTAPIGSATLLPRMSIAYQRAYGDIDGVAAQRFGGTGPTFVVAGAGFGKDGLAVDGGFDLLLGNRFSVGIGGFASTSDRWSDYGGKATVGLRF